MRIALAALIFLFFLVTACSAPLINEKAGPEASDMATLPCHRMNDGTMMSNCEEHTALKAHAEMSSEITVQDIRVSFSPQEAKTTPTSLRFTIQEKYTGNPWPEFTIVHEKPMHLVLVRDDLRYFAHLHPQHIAPGNFLANYTFLAPGKYRLWIDFTSKEQQYLVDFDLEVSGEEQKEPDTLGNVTVFFQKPEKIVRGQDTPLTFSVYDSQRKPFSITMPFLGAAAHLISIDQTLTEFSHDHDMIFDGDSLLSFQHRFQTAGKHQHRLWVQFNAAGEARTAAFDVDVKE